jgi:hypothetical protein
MAEYSDVDLVLNEALSVLPETKLLQPIGNRLWPRYAHVGNSSSNAFGTSGHFYGSLAAQIAGAVPAWRGLARSRVEPSPWGSLFGVSLYRSKSRAKGCLFVASSTTSPVCRS